MKSPAWGVFDTVVSGLLASLLWGSAFADPIRILPLGDSLTAGQASTDTIGAYRPELYRALTESGYQIDLLGTLHDSINPTLPDPDHQGVNSARIDQLQAGLSDWLDELPDPDVVLLLAGTNDFWQGSDLPTVLARYEQLLRSMATRCPYAQLIAATLPPRLDQDIMEQQQVAFNHSLVSLVSQLRAEGISITLADIHQALLPEQFSADGVHPNASGYQQIGLAWSVAVRQVMPSYGSDVPPEILRIVPDPLLDGVTVQFNKPISIASLSDCRVDAPPGYEMTQETAGSDARSLHLNLTPPLGRGEKYWFVFSGILDQAPQPHPIAPGTVASVTTSALENGGFEDSDGWTLRGHVSSNSGSPYLPTEGNHLLTFNAGQQSPDGVASQTIPTVPGQDYWLSFDYGVIGYNHNSQSLRFSVTGDVVLHESQLHLTSTGIGECQWSRFAQRITADSSSITLTWQDESLSTTDIDALLDQVSLIPLIDDGIVNGNFQQGLFGWEQSGNPPIVVNYAPYVTSETERVLVFNGDQSEVDGGITQSFPTQPGQTYAVEGAIGAFGDPTAMSPTLNASLRGKDLRHDETLELKAVGFLTPIWKPFSWVFVADSLVTTLRFSDASLSTRNVDLLLGEVRLHPTTPRLLQLDHLANGSFESGESDWSLHGNSVIIRAFSPYQAVNGDYLLVFNGGQTTPNAEVSQMLKTVPGGEYELRFKAGVLSYNGSSQKLRIEVNNGLPNTKDFSWDGPKDGEISWNETTFRFRATGETTQLTLRDISPDGDVTDLLLDDLEFSRVNTSSQSDPSTVNNPIAPRLGIVVEQTSTHLTLDVVEAGNYRIESSQDLVHWQTLQSIDATQSSHHSIEDPGPLPIRRYYRVAWISSAPEP